MAQTKKIIIVDDDPDILEALQLILEDSGYTVKTTLKGEDLFVMLKRNIPDAIIIDVLLSGMDGREVTQRIKSDSKTKNIPVIMMSAHPSAKESAKQFGAACFVSKPFEIDDILNALKKYTSV